MYPFLSKTQDNSDSLLFDRMLDQLAGHIDKPIGRF